ncbi:hypothetical protein CCACVL1_04743 [Corchorus capsularis]|uniref:Uncharacterized protein n=1 Tax=Corchorus capsularis TaxID=210143 RepID=A0A1R3JQ29_COCAP|nr:hypothetical protein CCACVL1_04743 [Corchorus capsularis]
MTSSSLPSIPEIGDAVDIENLVKTQVAGMKSALMDDIRDLFNQFAVRDDMAREKLPTETPANSKQNTETTTSPQYNTKPPFYAYTPPPWNSPMPQNPYQYQPPLASTHRASLKQPPVV